MITAKDLFLQSGVLYAEPNFWNPEECWQLREISKFSPSEDAGIYADGKQGSDSRFRRTKRILLSQSVSEEIQRSILTIRPRLERHFGMHLSGLQPCQFLQYNAGCYFRPHQDEKERVSDSSRKISVVVFLNSQTMGPNVVFSGGDIIFYKDMAHNMARDGFRCCPEEGLLVAFPSYLIHEVDEVTGGIRYSIVSWFF